MHQTESIEDRLQRLEQFAMDVTAGLQRHEHSVDELHIKVLEAIDAIHRSGESGLSGLEQIAESVSALLVRIKQLEQAVY